MPARTADQQARGDRTRVWRIDHADHRAAPLTYEQFRLAFAKRGERGRSTEALGSFRARWEPTIPLACSPPPALRSGAKVNAPYPKCVGLGAGRSSATTSGRPSRTPLFCSVSAPRRARPPPDPWLTCAGSPPRYGVVRACAGPAELVWCHAHRVGAIRPSLPGPDDRVLADGSRKRVGKLSVAR